MTDERDAVAGMVGHDPNIEADFRPAHTQRLSALSNDPDCAEYDLPCGCSLDATGHDLPDFTFCSTHAAAPDLLAALKALTPLAEYLADSANDAAADRAIVAARVAIAKATG